MSGGPVVICTARMGDYDALVALFDELDEFHRLARPWVFRRFDGPARTRGQIEQWLIGAGSTVLVAELDGMVAGLAVLLTRPPSPFAGAVPLKAIELDNLVVHPDQRGQRIGRRLLAAVVEWARQRRAAQVEAVVGAGDARRFYESFGFAAADDRLVLTA